MTKEKGIGFEKRTASQIRFGLRIRRVRGREPSHFALIRICFEEFCYIGNVGVLGEMLSKFSKTHVFVLAITHLN